MVLGITFFRHGITQANAKFVGGDGDDPLLDLGIFQGELLASYLQDTHFDVLWSSDFNRASFLLCQIAWYHMNTPLLFSSAFREGNLGIYVNRPLQEIDKYHPSVESDVAIKQRLKPVYALMQERYWSAGTEHQEIGIVSHGSLIKNSLELLADEPISKEKMFNTGVTRIEKEHPADELFSIKYFNQIPHLKGHDYAITPKPAK